MNYRCTTNKILILLALIAFIYTAIPLFEEQEGCVDAQCTPIPIAYPVGAIFSSSVATNPSSLLGYGTWSQINGRFLVGVGNNGDGKNYVLRETDGTKDATVVSHDHPHTDPRHRHNSNIRTNANNSSGGGAAGTPTGTANYTNNNSPRPPITIGNPPGSAPLTDRNLPPYEAVYHWERIS